MCSLPWRVSRHEVQAHNHTHPGYPLFYSMLLSPVHLHLRRGPIHTQDVALCCLESDAHVDLRIDRAKQPRHGSCREVNCIVVPGACPAGKELPEGAQRMPDQHICSQYDHADCIHSKVVLPRLNALSDYIQWAEECAARHGIVPPYQRSDFNPTSVYSRMLSRTYV